jgi:hypothetical protein
MGEAFLLTVLRLGLPVIVLFAAGYLVHRYRARLEEMFTGADLAWRAPSAGGRACGAAQEKACWQVMACPLAVRNVCPAYDRTYLPCWLARKLARGGQFPEKCLSCALYRPEQAIPGIAAAGAGARQG